MSAVIASAAIAAVGVGYKIYTGIHQNSMANKLARGNVRPMYKIQDEYYRNQGLAENQAQSGLGENSLNYYGDQANRGLSTGISGVLQGGGDVNGIGSLYDKFNQGNRAIAVENARLKNDNIRYLIDRNKDLAGQETQQWAINKYEPFKDTSAAIANPRGAGSQNISSGISEAGSAASTLSSGLKSDTGYSTGPNTNNIISSPTITQMNQGSNSLGSPNPFNTVGGMTVPQDNTIGSATITDMNRTSDSLGTPDPFNTKGGTIVPGSAIDPNVINATANNNVLKNYQNSPYYEQLSAYLNQAVA